ncbi:MAG: hypothetical protein CSA97_04645 [Bacteroidetes bacterium]|nr:MAG: hypothetical protein CSA97_04645 [Bacteroidota bacterium]
MFKGFALGFYSLVVLVVSLLSGDAVQLAMTVAQEVTAGSDFDVSVHVEKDDELEGFARFQASLPRGLKAVEGEGRNADFRYADKRARFVWMRMPAVSDLDLVYKVHVDKRLRGEFELGGELSYISQNERKVAVLEPQKIVIVPSPEVPAEEQLDLDEFQKSIPAQRDVSIAQSRVRCVRERPIKVGDGEDLIVRILVNRGEALKFAKIEEKLPAGYTAEPVETREAIFSIEEGMVKFIWMSLPTQQRFSVSYRLIPQSSKSKEPTLVGKFSFVENDATRVINIVQRGATVSSPGDLEKFFSQGSGASAMEEGEGVGSGRRGKPSAGRKRGRKPSRRRGLDPASQSGQSGSGAARRPARRPSGRQRPSKYGPSPSMSQYMLAPEEGIYYRVQVAAGHRPINVNRYFKRLSLNADVRTEWINGWYKYSVGMFRVYHQARDYRVKIWNTTPINDAFVAAYNNGRRITVQEALMITSQKWYR